MKEYTIDEFVNECVTLCKNPYTHTFESGICNGHTVEQNTRSMTCVVIDRCCNNLGVINEKWPDGSVEWVVDNGKSGKSLNVSQYIRWMLEQPA